METSESTNGQTTQSNASGENQTTTQTEPVRNPEGVLNKNRELLGTNKTLSTEVSTLRDQLKNLQDNEKISEGQKDEVIKSLREELKTAKGTLQETTDSYNWNTVESQLKQAALKEGCVDADKLVKLIDSGDLSALEVDGNYKVNVDDLTSLLTKAKKGNPFLFTESSANINDLNPSNKIQKVVKKPIDQMTTQEIEAALNALEK